MDLIAASSDLPDSLDLLCSIKTWLRKVNRVSVLPRRCTVGPGGARYLVLHSTVDILMTLATSCPDWPFWPQGDLGWWKNQSSNNALKMYFFLLPDWLFHFASFVPFPFPPAVTVLNYNELKSTESSRLFLGHFFWNSLLVHSSLISCEGLGRSLWKVKDDSSHLWCS